MKKISIICFVLLAAAFITAQSFRYTSHREPVKSKTISNFKAYPSSAAMCTPLFPLEDPAADIGVLKGWGNYQWKISAASDSVQYYFNQGINLYFAFHNIESIASFTKATHLDPTSAMAWYGKALAMGPTINYSTGYRAPAEALEAAVKSKQLADKCSPLEKDLITAIQARYSADTTMDVKQLRVNYAAAMKKAYEQHKQNADMETLYADALLLIHPWDLYDHASQPKPWTAEIRQLLENAMVLSPKHPGANHFYIHTMEASAHPETALNSAHLLDTLMPQVAHITHMSSHIYIRTGDYQRGIKVNETALNGYNSYLKSYAPVANGLGLYELHNIHMKSNNAQMAGNYKIAMEATLSVQKKIVESGYLAAPGPDGNFIQYIYSSPILTNVRFGKWDEVLNTPKADTLIYASVLRHFARGLAYSSKGNMFKAKAELKLMSALMKNSTLKLNLDNFSNAYDGAQVGKYILMGMIAENQKQHAEAIKYLEQAVTAEDHLVYNEPRDWPIPARQYLGYALINAGQASKAITVFNRDLQINPKNGWSLTGLTLAYRKTGNQPALALTSKQLKTAWAINDTKISSSVF